MGSRERRLWVIAAVIVVAVFSTVGVTGDLAARLDAQNLIDHLFFWGAMGLFAALGLVGFRARWRGIEIGVVVGAIAVLTLAALRMTIPERTHLVEYGMLAIVLFEARMERTGGRIGASALFAALVATAAGALDEVVQIAVPGRVFDPVDIAFNGIAAAVTAGSAAAIRTVAARRAARALRGA
ncbi:MAG: VanZ family protein [Acidimicrobiia bacterium]|nr:VanZ family protein [Acidimicrobiia bacterium]